MSDYLIITSSGGGGHKVAGDAILQKKLQKHKGASAKELDVMRSSCCYGSWLGRKCTDAWDKAQAEGDVDKQYRLFKFQAVSEAFFFIGTFFTVFNQLIRGEKLPEKVICTQPFHLFAITSAVRLANVICFKQERKIKRVELYYTDLPTEKAKHFQQSLKRLHWISKKGFELIRVHAPEPISKTMSPAEFWEKHTSLQPHQVKVENMPVGNMFKDPGSLPLPGAKTELEIQRLTQTEQVQMQKLHPDQKGSFKIESADQVGLVMLGSVPEKQAILHYVDEMIAASKECKVDNEGHNVYLFVACGSHAFNGKVPDKKCGAYPMLNENCLYNQVCTKILEANLPARVKIVPFIGQPVARIFGRSNISLTRSGGITSGEILALKSRDGDNKRVLIHSSLTKIPEGSEEEKSNALLERIPLWENGNADYLTCHKDVKAKIVNPQLAKNEFIRLF